MCDSVLFNYHWLHAKISAVPISNVLEDFTRAIPIIKDVNLRRQVLDTIPKIQKFYLLRFIHKLRNAYRRKGLNPYVTL